MNSFSTHPVKGETTLRRRQKKKSRKKTRASVHSKSKKIYTPRRKQPTKLVIRKKRKPNISHTKNHSGELKKQKNRTSAKETRTSPPERKKKGSYAGPREKREKSIRQGQRHRKKNAANRNLTRIPSEITLTRRSPQKTPAKRNGRRKATEPVKRHQLRGEKKPSQGKVLSARDQPRKNWILKNRNGRGVKKKKGVNNREEGKKKERKKLNSNFSSILLGGKGSLCLKLWRDQTNKNRESREESKRGNEKKEKETHSIELSYKNPSCGLGGASVAKAVG